MRSRPVLIGWLVQSPPGPEPPGSCWTLQQLPTFLQSVHLVRESEHETTIKSSEPEPYGPEQNQTLAKQSGR